LCIVLFSYANHASYSIIVAHNRDEYYERAALPAHFWGDNPNILAGRDLEYGGTWLGVTRNGRIALLTNYRKGRPVHERKLPRGLLVPHYLAGSLSPRHYAEALYVEREKYRPFNMILGNLDKIVSLSSESDGMRSLDPGYYGLSNNLLNVSWPKVRRGLVAFRKAVTEGEGGSKADLTASLFEILSDPTPARDDELPDTGIGRELERVLSPIFVRTPVYGTRVSTVVLLRRDGGATFLERTFAPDGGEPSTSTYRFQIGG
jgi:uncharacterized protein with NRDE domain